MTRVALLLALLVAAARPAFADAKSESILLFDEGIREMKAGNHARACTAFERSNALLADSGTKGSLARCYEKLNRLASAWLLWRELADTAPTPDLRRNAAAQVTRLEPRIARYVIKVVAPTPGLRVTINGKPTAVDGTPIPVPIDAGKVHVVAGAEGYRDWTADFTVADAGRLEIPVPLLVISPNQPVVKPPLTVDTSRRRKRRWIAAGFGGAGAVALGVSGAFALKARGTYADAEDACGGAIDRCADETQLGRARGLVDDSRKQANLATILVGAGGALVITGAILYFTAPAAEQRPRLAITPVTTPALTGLVVSGRF
jgi:hypothetical protein